MAGLAFALGAALMTAGCSGDDDADEPAPIRPVRAVTVEAGQSGQVVTLTGGGPGQSTTTLAYLVYSIAFRWYDMGYASAVAWILTAMLVFLAVWYMKLILRKPGGA